MTSNELAHQTDDNLSILPAQRPSVPAAIGQLMQHAEAMGAAKKLADAMCSSELVPAIYRGKPANGAAAILYGGELGLNPIQSLQQIFVVHGQPAIYARTMVALVKSHGYAIQTVESTDTSVTVRGGDPRTGETEESTWTYERARRAGYTSNKKYETDPQAMLYAKAATEVCRKIAPHVLLGIAYSREELELEQPQYVRNEAQTTTGAAGLRQRLAGPVSKPAEDAPADPPVADETQAANEPPAEEKKPAQKLITAAQLKRLHAMLGDAGLGNDRAGALAFMSDVVQRELTTSKDLTSEEVQKVFESLENGGRTTDQ
ncbi:RecT-like ssDNA binding protein [Gordonia phage SmokingBunny]|uniref:RecT-like ssDNA binding protein n=1 Tax=Gordonia phage SmokingBunny TaxID=2572528 RepID=A0A4D6T708_9CAUD|nr:RecT-like ssDNA annealing protein [Gordonia phage SmokingBunny]QCG77866.1 RecT-like ssDNA binding protein [Gordonia phage SmokingBunny]WAA20272.1 RecT-like ssDNA binding protein [Gordonia phage Togo]